MPDAPTTIPYQWAGGLSTPWTQYISRQGRGTTQSAFRNDQTRRTIQIDVDGQHGLQAVADALGFAVRTPGPYAPLGWTGTTPNGGAVAGPPYYFHRQTPMVHPETPWLVCTEVLSFDPLVFNNKNLGNQYTGPFAEWKRVRITLGFSSLPYAVFSDDVDATLGPLPSTQLGNFYFNDWLGGYRTPGDEYWRYTIRTPETSNEILLRERGQLYLAEGVSAGTALHMGVSLRQSKTRWRIQWIGVPDTGLLDDTGHAQLLDRALGRVNSSWFYGFAPYTLLYNGYKLTPHELPVDPALVLSRYPNVARAWDVEWDIVEFAPTALAGVVGGWQSAPDWITNLYAGAVDPLHATAVPKAVLAPVAISSLTSSGSTVTLVTGSPHGYIAGEGFTNQCWINVAGAAAQIGGVGPLLGQEYEGQFFATIVDATTLTYQLKDTDVLGAAPSPAPGASPYVMYGRRIYDTVDPRVPWTALPPGV